MSITDGLRPDESRLKDSLPSAGTSSVSSRRKNDSSLLQLYQGAAQWTVGILVPAFLVILWEGFAQAGLLPPNMLPAPSKVLLTIVDLYSRGELVDHIGITLYRVFAGFLIGTFTATVLGISTGYSPLFRRLFDPLLQGLRNIPSMAWVPLFLLWMGIEETSKIMLIAVGVFFPVYLNLMTGLQNVDRKLVEVGRVYGLRGLQLIRRIYLPATIPAYMTGLRSGLGLGWMFVVAAEIMGASKGLGYLMTDGQMTGRPAIILGSIILFAVFGKLTDMIVEMLAERLVSWQKQ
ncbi:ABC transporter permease [Heliobacterium chlorum]|uniref:ABC transporter permease n=1 Tax=Heliobacterium chlorum TaxID=2698 RepID=A0ABR7T713_HELCL|nr:ABC transporter permease [Heliobacterium chlorum]MBC9785486.1 ABC transporter permease [Heliobacterium chlorum]